jgi:phage-related minor tail protein
MQSEIDRLHALKKVNPNVREAEISHQQELFSQTIETLEKLKFKLDAIRILVNA